MAGAALCVPIRWPDPYFCLLGHGRPPLQGVLSIPWILRSFVFFARETSAEFRCRAGLERGGAAGSGAAPCRAEPSLLPRAPPADRPPWPGAGRGLAAGPRSGGCASPPPPRRAAGGCWSRRRRCRRCAAAGHRREASGRGRERRRGRRRGESPRPRGARRRRRGEKGRGCEGMCLPAAGTASLG